MLCSFHPEQCLEFANIGRKPTRAGDLLSIEIQGMQFSGFAGIDKSNLPLLDYSGRVQWLRYRINLVFLTPFERIISLQDDCYVWLCVTNLLCAAIEALADFEFDGSGMQRFSQFVETYFCPEFRSHTLHLDDPKPNRTPATTPAEHLYRYFRCGLAHSFCIEWGGLLHREDGASAYLFERDPIGNGQYSLGIVPRELVADFTDAANRFFQNAETWVPGAQKAERFDERFREVFLLCATPTP
jgi:hypothetical protein